MESVARGSKSIERDKFSINSIHIRDIMGEIST
jgi:hypothetical protein